MTPIRETTPPPGPTSAAWPGRPGGPARFDRPVADRLMRRLARLLVRVFFRRIEVDGADRLPLDRPLVVVANHTNGLVDGLLLIAMLGRYPRFLGKSTLFRILPLRPFLRLAGVVPVYRATDGATDGNDRTFQKCRQLLARRGVVAIFPEGVSHDEASLQPLRTGAARIALGAAFDEQADGVVVVPVGLVYDAKARFRSSALLTIGDPLEVDGFRRRYQADPHAATRQLTDAIATSLRQVGPDYATVAEAVALARVADIVTRPTGGARPTEASMADRAAVARALARADGASATMTDLLAASERYLADLAVVGVTDADVAADLTRSRYRWTLVWTAVKLVVTAPIALLGAVIHVVPYEVVKGLARRPANEGIRSTVKLLGCAALFVLEWIGLAVLTAVTVNGLVALVVLVGCPLAGYVTVRFAERVRAAGGLAHGYRTLRVHRTSRTGLRAERQRVVEQATVAASMG